MNHFKFLKICLILLSFIGSSAIADSKFCATNQAGQPITVWCGQYWGFGGIPLRWTGYVTVGTGAKKSHFYTAKNNAWQANIDRGYWYCYLYDQNGEELFNSYFSIHNEGNNLDLIILKSDPIAFTVHKGAGTCP